MGGATGAVQRKNSAEFFCGFINKYERIVIHMYVQKALCSCACCTILYVVHSTSACNTHTRCARSTLLNVYCLHTGCNTHNRYGKETKGSKEDKEDSKTPTGSQGCEKVEASAKLVALCSTYTSPSASGWRVLCFCVGTKSLFFTGYVLICQAVFVIKYEAVTRIWIF